MDSHIELLNYLIKKHNFKSYLEIGVAEGDCFGKINCDHKIGVDPGNRFPEINFNLTSDIFFKTNKETFDIIFVDGYHEENQLIRDVENSLKFLNKDGIIVCHDVNALRDEPPQPDWGGYGTCWRGWVRLRAERDDLLMYVVDIQSGCGIIKRGKQEKLVFDELTWQNFQQNRSHWLGLISPDRFLERYRKTYMKSTRDAFGYQLPLMGKQHENIVALDADLGKATKISNFKDDFPDRFFQIGIAEANMIGIASGLSEYGNKVFLASFASFLTGRYDIIRCSIAYPNCPVILVGTHVGMAIGKDGVTQMGLEDVGIMRGLPNIKILNPATYSEAIKCITYLCETNLDSPHYLRLGRQPVEDVFENKHFPFEFGKGVVVKSGNDITLFSTGCILPDVLNAAKIIEKVSNCTVEVINFHTLKPIDKERILVSAKANKLLFSIEDHSVIGGLGSIISEVLTDEYPVHLTRIGLDDVFPESGPPDELYEKYGLSAKQIAEKVLKVWK